MNLDLIRELPKKQINLKSVLQDAIIPEMNIYNQAYLEIHTPLVTAGVIHPKTPNEFGVEFKLEGQIKGRVYCFLDTFQKRINPKEESFFQLLFVESMNILIGRTLTNLEENSHCMSVILEPQFLKLNDSKEVVINKGSSISETFSIGYKLIALLNEYDCRIIFEIEK